MIIMWQIYYLHNTYIIRHDKIIVYFHKTKKLMVALTTKDRHRPTGLD